MANRPDGYGYTADIHRKLAAKYNNEDEIEIVDWIKNITHRDGPKETGKYGFKNWLMDGQVLCALANAFGYSDTICKPHDTSKYSPSSPMKKMKENENIGMFLAAITRLGVAPIDLFQTVDLREGQNLSQVQTTLYKVGTALMARKWTGASIGVTKATENPREFSAEQQRAGSNVIGLQMGTNQVASQRGMTAYGLGRQIVNNENK